MRTLLRVLLICLFFSFVSVKVRGQGILGLGATGISGLPANTAFGDTLDNLGVWLVNQGIVPVSNVIVSFLADPNHSGSPLPIGTLDLTAGGILQPGDTMYVPLDYFVVSPQNSNQGANVMVVWPTAIGHSAGDTARGDYIVDGTTAAHQPQALEPNIKVWPNPNDGQFNVQADLTHLPMATCKVINVMGVVVYESKLSELQLIEIPYLRTGLFFLLIFDKDKLVYRREVFVK